LIFKVEVEESNEIFVVVTIYPDLTDIITEPSSLIIVFANEFWFTPYCNNEAYWYQGGDFI